MSFGRRLFGTFFDPGRTFRAIAERPLWVDILIFLLILVSLYTYLVFPYGQKDSLRRLEDNAAKLKGKWGESGYTGALERIRERSRPLSAFLVTPLIFLTGLLFSALIVLGMGRLITNQGNYLKVFSPLLHASLVDKLLGNGLRFLLVSSRKSVLQTSTGLPIFFPRLDVTSAAYSLLGQVDFFQIWTFCLFGIGLAASFKISLKKGLVISFAFWLVKSLLTSGLIILRARMFQ
jgi:Yip1 domain